MNKKQVYFCLIILSILFFVNSCDIVSEEVVKNNTNPQDTSNFSATGKLHWDHMPVTYRINDMSDCTESEVPSKIREALLIIKNNTDRFVYFQEIKSNDSDIIFNCIDKNSFIEQHKSDEICIQKNYSYYKETISISNENILNEEYQYMTNATAIKLTETESIWKICYLDQNALSVSLEDLTIGDARPDVQGKIIKHAVINIYKTEMVGFESYWSSCAYLPSREIHELLHAFGIGHAYMEYYSDDPSSDTGIPIFVKKDIMSPIKSCDYQRELQSKYTLCLKYIYSNGEVGSCEDVDFLYETSCDPGWYPVDGSEFCCPGPNMTIQGDYCYE